MSVKKMLEIVLDNIIRWLENLKSMSKSEQESRCLPVFVFIVCDETVDEVVVLGVRDSVVIDLID